MQSLHLIRQEMKVSQKQLGEFCEALKQYLKNVSAQRDCFQWVRACVCAYVLMIWDISILCMFNTFFIIITLRL